jgi:hypothetical protein
MVGLVKNINKRDLQAVKAVEKEKRKNQNSDGLPIKKRYRF